ncbi:hypothetical protein ACFQZQ_09420 [Lysobacter koreensis]|uniref:AsmA family protein n=1 Tax=Lysobacter koreensis TaxID=266122 RepID=A0ABW2YNR5_9GAMM
MSAAPEQNSRPSHKRAVVFVVLLLVLLALLALALRWVAQPERMAGLLLDRIGAALGLQISASGASEYRLRGTPTLVLRDVVAREPGAATPVLRARRVYLSLPWSTIRARGRDLTVERIELDAPQIDLPALQHWQATRPPAEKRFPTLTAGLRISDGAIANDNWRVDRIHADLPSLYPDRPMQARLRGRYLDPPLAIPVDLAVAITRPQALIQSGVTGFAAHGRVTLERGDWRMPATLALSGPLRLGDDQLQVTPARLGMAAAYESGTTRLPFALGLHSPLVFDEATWTLAPAGVALRGRGATDTDPVPTLDAHGTLALGRRVSGQLDGVIAQWPQAWPALPPPIGQSRSPLPFALRYDGKPDFSDTAALRLRRDATVFDGRFRLPEVLAWTKAAASGSPLPPIDGTLSTPTLVISGATLEGVEIEFDDGQSPLL